MSFACQRDSYQQAFETNVISCELAKIRLQDTQKVSGYNVVFEDTILFPEGGGQNDDHGTIISSTGNECDSDNKEVIPVLRVVRNGDKAVHFLQTNNPLELGTKVKQIVDWERRFDHMQQHTGQHLISALFEKLFKIETSSWWMAENDEGKVGISSIEMNVESLCQEQLEAVENACNKAIKDHLDVSVNVYQLDNPALAEAHTRGLPDDMAGPVRVIQIGNKENLLDSNLCCGTHVSNLSHLQMVQLLYVEKAKKGKGKKCNVFFLVGDRIRIYLKSSFIREQKMNVILSSGAGDHLSLVEKITKANKASSKTNQVLLKEIASRDAEMIKEKSLRYFMKHRNEPDPEYSNTLIREIDDVEVMLIIITGDEKKGPFQLTLFGPEKIMTDLGQKIICVLDAKGGGKGKRRNAKFLSLANKSKVDDLLKEYFE